MKVEGSQVYPVPVDAVIACCRDKSATVDKYEGMGHRDVEILEFAADDGMMRIVSSRRRRCRAAGVREEGAQADEHDGPNRRVASSGRRVVVRHVRRGRKGSPVRISGTMGLAPDAEGSRHDVVLDLQVKVPIVGGKIADWSARRTSNARSTPSSRSTRAGSELEGCAGAVRAAPTPRLTSVAGLRGHPSPAVRRWGAPGRGT